MIARIRVRSRLATAGLLFGWISTASTRAADLNVPATYPTIQAAVDAASKGDTIRIAPGVYAGQVLISNKSLTLSGAPGAVLRATAEMSQPYADLGLLWVPLLGVLRSDVVVSNLTFDGGLSGGFQAPDFGFAGVYFLGSGGRVEDCRITGFRGLNPGWRYGSGIRVVNPVDLGTSTVAVQILRSIFTENSCSVEVVGDSLSTRRRMFDPNLLRTTFVISDNTITGHFPGLSGTQQGIHIYAGATGEVSRNTISDLGSVSGGDPYPTSFGILADDGMSFGGLPLAALLPIRFEGNTLLRNQWHLLVLRGDGSTIVGNTFDGYTFDGWASGKRPTGLGLSGENVLVASNRFSNLPQGIVLLGQDPDYGTYLGIAHNTHIATNQFCNIATNVVVQPLATETEQGTLACGELTSITSTTNGVRVAWAGSGPGNAYTVQYRDSLTEGAWKNGTMRYRWPWPFNYWADAPRSLPSARFYRVVVQPTVAPDRGRLITSKLKGQFSLDIQKNAFAHWGITNFVTAKFGMISRVFTYETVDPYGLSITNSAELLTPIGANGPLPLVSAQHGTLVARSDSPTQPDSGDIWGVVFACVGYAVVVPDYIGLGSSPGYQAYLHAHSEATCVVDALRAGKALCASNSVVLNGQLFLAGYSQGGHVTMAAHRELEAWHADEFTVTASAPCGGPYDLGGAVVQSLLTDPAYPDPWYFPIVVASYLPIYHLGDTLEELLAPPYRSTLPPRLDGNHSIQQLWAETPADPVAILRPDFQADFRANADNPLRRALLDNNVYSWVPKAPVKMFHCRGDRDVIFANAEIAYQSFTNRGACCVSVVDPGAPAELNHDECYEPSLRGVLEWFDSLRR